MATGRKLRDDLGLGRYLRSWVLPLAPQTEPVPFRGQLEDEADALPFIDELESDILGRPGAVWNVVGDAGTGKSLLGRWAAARWARRFLESPDESCVPLVVGYRRLHDITHEFAEWDLASIVAAAGLDLSRRARRRIVEALRDQPVVLIVDWEHEGTGRMASFRARPRSLSDVRFLHLALAPPAEGTTVRLGPWDLETTLLAAHRLGGAAAVARVEALARSPAAPLASYPLFVCFLIEAAGLDPETIARDGGVPAFLTELHSRSPLSPFDFTDWCWLLYRGEKVGSELWIAPKHHLYLWDSGEWSSVFRAYLLAHLVRVNRLSGTLAHRRLPEAELDRIDRVLTDPSDRRPRWDPEPLRRRLERLRHGRGGGGEAQEIEQELANLLALKWRLSRERLPESLLRLCRTVSLPGYRFADGIDGLSLTESNLQRISLGRPRARDSRFTGCDLSRAGLAGATFERCSFVRCELRLARLTRSELHDCRFEHVDLAEAVLARVLFFRTVFEDVRFGGAQDGKHARFEGCQLVECDIRGLAPRGFHWRACDVRGVLFCGLDPSAFRADGSTFHLCDFLDFRGRGASLSGVTFETCILAGADLREADLRGARLIRVEFQPGPSSRSGLTGEWTRWHPMYRSQSGFYAEDLAEGVYGDPELLRTADLRGADLRGAEILGTDLFRVDLRGARLDDSLREEARRMRAFVDD